MRKSSVLNEITSMRMDDEGDVHDYINKFFVIIGKLIDMETTMDNDVLCVMLLRSLSERFENFRCVIQSRDKLPDLETLRIKVIEKSDVRKNTRYDSQNAMIANRCDE